MLTRLLFIVFFIVFTITIHSQVKINEFSSDKGFTDEFGDNVDWIELIPFNETRNYVQRVIENIQVYKYVINKKTVANDIEKILF